MSLAVARGIAEYVQAKLGEWCCARIEVAGSVRRGKVMCGDVELVAVPLFREEQANLFETRRVSLVDEEIGRLGWPVLKGGERYKQLLVLGRFPVDLYLQPDPATWGVNFTLRTGSVDFAKWLVTPATCGGALPVGMKVERARLWAAGRAEPLDTPEEVDFFRALGLPWIEPAEREEGRWGVWAQSRQ